MKILQVGPLPPSVGGKTTGGVASHTWELSKALSRCGHEVAVFADNVFTGKANRVVDDITIYGITPRLDPPHYEQLRNYHSRFRGWSIPKKIKYFIILLSARHCLDSLNPDLIHIHHLQHRYQIIQILRPETPCITTIHSFHSVTFQAKRRRSQIHEFINQNLKQSKNIIFVSGELVRQCQELFGALPDNYYTVNNPVCLENIEQSPSTPPTFDDYEQNILFVGDLIPRKGWKTLLHACGNLNLTTNVGVHLVGTGPHENDAREYVVENELDFIHVHGYVDEINPFYHHADLFVLPTQGESFGLVFIEAMAHGTPVVGTSEVPKAVIPSEDVGLRVTPNDPPELSRAIEGSLERDWNTDAIRSFANTFSWSANISTFEDIYDDVIDNW